MSWGSRRRAMYIGTFATIIVVIVAITAFRAFYEAPTCFDGKQNGGEAGVDCGGSCEAVCRFQAVEPIVLWNRFFPVRDGMYNAIVMLQNQNVQAQAHDVPYVFRLRNDDNTLINEVSGTVDIPAELSIPLFIPNISAGTQVPARSTFSFTGEPVWRTAQEPSAKVRIGETELTNASTSPRLTVEIHNDTLFLIEPVKLVALLSDARGNAIGASQTILDSIAGDSSRSVVFTWPQPFTEPVAKIEVLPQTILDEL